MSCNCNKRKPCEGWLAIGLFVAIACFYLGSILVYWTTQGYMPLILTVYAVPVLGTVGAYGFVRSLIG